MRTSSRKMTFALAGLILSYSALTVAGQHNSERKLPKRLVQQLVADITHNEKKFRLSDEDLSVLQKHLKFELHDLNADRASEFFIFIDHSDWCGAGANCSYWVYQKVGGGYRLLVEDKVVRVRETITRGYRDLSSETPVGFCERNVQRVFVTPYEYEEGKYRARASKYECRPFTPNKN